MNNRPVGAGSAMEQTDIHAGIGGFFSPSSEKAGVRAAFIRPPVLSGKEMERKIFGLPRRVRITFYLYSKISPGWHWSALQVASRVDSRIAFTLPFFKTEILAIVMPTFSASSVTLIFRFANMTSMLIMIAMLVSLYREVVLTFDIHGFL